MVILRDDEDYKPRIFTLVFAGILLVLFMSWNYLVVMNYPITQSLNGYLFYPLFLLLSILIAADSWRRDAITSSLGWVLGGLLLGVVFVPLYFAKRDHLRKGEDRKSCLWWNTLKYFAILWTVLMVVLCLQRFMPAIDPDYLGLEKIMNALPVMVYAELVVLVVVPTMIIGFFLKKSNELEKGPKLFDKVKAEP